MIQSTYICQTPHILATTQIDTSIKQECTMKPAICISLLSPLKPPTKQALLPDTTQLLKAYVAR